MNPAISQCTGKDRLTWAVAKTLAKRQRKKAGEPLQAYRCRICGHWHIGRKKQ